MLLQPGLELAFGLHLGLQGAQGFQPCGGVPELAGFAVDSLLRRAALFVQLRHLLAQLVQPGFRDVTRFVGRRFVALEQIQAGHVRRDQALLLTGQLLAPAFERA